MGSPQNVVLPWTIPAGTPNHSCVFGVVRSDAEPEGDQSSLDWWQFETLSYNDNDWAQRNLDIENVSSDNDSNLVESAPFFIELPPRKLRLDNVLTLEVDATQAKGLKRLYLEITGADRLEIQAGEKQKLKIDIANKRERLVGVFNAEIPPRQKKGTTFTVGADPSIGGRSFIGWGTQFAVAGPREVIAQILDSAAAGFGDLSEFAELPGVRRLFCMIGDTVCKRAYSAEDLASRLLEYVKDIENAASQLKRIDAARETGADEAISRLLRAVTAYGSGQARAGEVLEAYRAAANRAMMAAALLGRD